MYKGYTISTNALSASMQTMNANEFFETNFSIPCWPLGTRHIFTKVMSPISILHASFTFAIRVSFQNQLKLELKNSFLSNKIVSRISLSLFKLTLGIY